VIGEDTGGWMSPYRDPGDRMTEAELVDAYRNAARADLDDELEPVTGVPVAVHAELRELRLALAGLHETITHVGLQVATLRELVELQLAVAGIDPDQLQVRARELTEDELRDARDEVDRETSSWTTDGRAGWQ
jgi:hypothetical protein